MKSKSTKKNAKMVVENFLEDGGLFDDDEIYKIVYQEHNFFTKSNKKSYPQYYKIKKNYGLV
jgi:hypothetical protein